MMTTRQSTARAPERRAPAKPKRPDLRIVDAPKRDSLRAARVGTIAGALLFVALFALAAFQTVLIRAQDRLDDLNHEVTEQAEVGQQLRLQLADLQSPEHIAQVACDRLGMIAPHTVTFLEPTPQDDADATYVAPPPTSPKASTTTTTPKSSPSSTTTTPTTTPTTSPKAGASNR